MTAQTPTPAPPVKPQQSQAKAIIGALLAIVATVAESLAREHNITWTTVLVAVLVAVAAHQGVFWTSNEPRGKHQQLQ